MNLKYKHYFEALPPKISMDKFEVFYPHPKTPIKVNEFGYAEVTDPGLAIYEPLNKTDCFGLRVVNGIQKGLYQKKQFLFCCYHSLGGAPKKILFLDGNPYNCTKGNLIGINYANPEVMLIAWKNTHAFISNTIQQIPIMIQKYSKFWSANDVVYNLKIPQEYIEFWQHPAKFKKFTEENEKAIEISIRKKIYKKNNIDYGF